MSSYTLDLSQALQQQPHDQITPSQGPSTITSTTATNEVEDMSSQEPTKRRKLPIIVDVALDSNGKQLYQIHESSKLVRKEMPRSTNFNLHHELTAEELSFIQNGGDPVATNATIIGNVSNQLGGGLGGKQQEDYYTHSSEDPDVSFFNEVGDAIGVNTDSTTQTGTGTGTGTGTAQSQIDANLGHANKLNQEGFSRVEDTDIWSEDVEQAFEEVLTFIPKNGLNKIKIAGRSCGRNELISDYIFTKTGKFRTRKQVSSHIQVLKNLGQNKKLIDLINNGPVFENDEDQAKILKKFEAVFSKINLSKSLGFSNSMKRKSVGVSSFGNIGGSQAAKSVTIHPPATKRRRKSHPSETTLPELEIGNFYMAINNYNSESVLLTIQKDSFNKYGVLKHLKLNDNATISHRFPGMAEFENCPHIPILHNMARIYLPHDFSPKLYDVGSGFSSNYNLKCKDYSPGSSTKLKSKQFSIFTCIYSYGQEVSKFNQTDVHLNQECRFITNFWKPFVRFVLMGKSIPEIATALRGLSIKQIVYESNHNNNESAVVHDANEFMVLKSKVNLVLLWEFSQVYDDPTQAFTTTTKIILPGGVNNDHLITADENIVPQVVTYNDNHVDDSHTYPGDDEGVDYDVAGTTEAELSVSSTRVYKAGNITATSIPTPGHENRNDFTDVTAGTNVNTTADTTTTTTTRPFSNKHPLSNPDYGPELRYPPHFALANDRHVHQQGMDHASFTAAGHPLHQSHYHHPDYEIQMQQQVPVHYHHPAGYKLHQSANMDLMMIPSGPVHLEPANNFQDYSYVNQGYIQGYASDY
ncbi:hypothetical protein CANMA_001410 [Candida margitis]|uniref:uncharacterized protein n=1 Tax=Candida margitis TaxID=1775924 RepID=UPI002227C408|nr:uncharacterized protein CANMA_001410 [Candida margitis]KAI5969560.1 hypothetical protein CANMA_001410 [Candida margitis]